ncbi:sigma-70 family RNA polymerase sigma factor [Ilumatobacter sp.]|uniref:sigma-70 family RNA polymerase sigma factor n=1 Tax=Ilumatobacter sp. TaxID=1967498 RepID=UPI003B51C9D9
MPADRRPNALSAEAAFERVRTDGDRAAFAVVYDEVAPKVYGTVLRVLRDPAMSEEVSQEVLVELWQTAARFDPERASLSTWATTMARRRAVDRVRREQSQRDRIEQVATLREIDDDGPENDAMSQIEAVEVRDALASLPDDQREVLCLSFLEGRAHGDIARRLDLPLGTVKGRVRGGLKKMKTSLGHTR